MSTRNEIEVTMPQLAESLVHAKIGKWLKQPGESFAAYEPLCEMITDKVVAELPATEAGVMTEIIAPTGANVAVGAVICRIQPETIKQGQAPLVETETVYSFEREKMEMKKRYSPAVQQLAQRHGIDLQHMHGTGVAGRITRKDVLTAVATGAEAMVQPVVLAEGKPAQPTLATETGLSLHEEDTFVEITPLRHTIATRMCQSLAEIPHAWTMMEVDVTNLVQLRHALKDEFKRKEGVNLTYLAFVMKAIVSAIKEYPLMNSTWAADKIIMKRDIHISLAVGTEEAVFTPVIKQADQKNIAGLAYEIDKFARKTRQGTLSFADMQGGTFTVNNTGSFGSILSKPIIHYPQAAILTFESIVKKPVVIQDMIAVRSVANMCLSLDHRILDGMICGKFLQCVKENIENLSLDTKIY